MLLSISGSLRAVDMSRIYILSLAVLLANKCAYADPAGITDDENAATVVTGELGKPLHVTCLESEEPTLYVFWYRGHKKNKLLKIDAVYGMRRNELLIRSLAIDTLGPYTCQAFNSKDMKPPRMYVVRAYKPDGTSSPASNWLVSRGTMAPNSETLPPTSSETFTTTKATTETSELNDPVRMPAGIAGDEDAVVTGELGSPLHLRCLTYGYPPPSVFWYRGFNEKALVIYKDTKYEAKENVLIIKSLNQSTLGEYTCGAYNGIGQAVSWQVIVRANIPEESLVNKNVLPELGTQSSITVETTSTGLLPNVER